MSTHHARTAVVIATERCHQTTSGPPQKIFQVATDYRRQFTSRKRNHIRTPKDISKLKETDQARRTRSQSPTQRCQPPRIYFYFFFFFFYFFFFFFFFFFYYFIFFFILFFFFFFFDSNLNFFFFFLLNHLINFFLFLASLGVARPPRPHRYHRHTSEGFTILSATW